MSEYWQIVDQRDKTPVGMAVYLTEDQAWRDISSWQDRHDRGGRPDITQDLLLNMKPVKVGYDD